MNQHNNDVLQFGPFRLDPAWRLTRAGKTVKISTKKKEGQALSGKPFEVLLVLVRARGRLVTKKELEREVWGGNKVSDFVLTQHIMRIRKFLGDNWKDPEYIETVPGKGWRLSRR